MFTVSSFPVGLHLYTSYESNSCCYTNAIFQENQEELRTNCICRNKALIPVDIVLTSLSALFQGAYICACPVISTAVVTQIVFPEIKTLILF